MSQGKFFNRTASYRRVFKRKVFEPLKTKIPPIALFLLLAALFPAWGNENAINFNIFTSVDWQRGELHAQTSFNLAQAGLRLPAGRLLGEDILQRAWPRLFRPQLLSIRVDSNSTIGDLIERGELSLQDLDALSRRARKTPPNLSADMTNMIGRYTVLVEEISGLLIRHRQTFEPVRPLIPVPTVDYTGIIIIADRELPVRGRNATARLEPSLFPKIWDTNMNLIYERGMVDPAIPLIVRYANAESIFRPTPSGLDGELAALVGPRPARIFAREVFGIYPTDPVIDHNDAMRILSSDHNRRLLREGRVAIVLDGARLGN